MNLPIYDFGYTTYAWNVKSPRYTSLMYMYYKCCWYEMTLINALSLLYKPNAQY